jgi:hypothetical protein
VSESIQICYNIEDKDFAIMKAELYKTIELDNSEEIAFFK